MLSAVVNSTPLISLHGIGMLDILSKIYISNELYENIKILTNE